MQLQYPHIATQKITQSFSYQIASFHKSDRFLPNRSCFMNDIKWFLAKDHNFASPLICKILTSLCNLSTVQYINKYAWSHAWSMLRTSTLSNIFYNLNQQYNINMTNTYIRVCRIRNIGCIYIILYIDIYQHNKNQLFGLSPAYNYRHYWLSISSTHPPQVRW